MSDLEFLKYIEDFNPNEEDIFVFLEEVRERWRWADYGFKLKRARKGFRTLKLVPSTSDSNRNIIASFQKNTWLSKMRYESTNVHEVLYRIPVV